MKNYAKQLDQLIILGTKKIQSISPEEMAKKPAPEKWSKKEILGHLVDSAQNNYQRFMRASEQGNLVFQGYPQAEWVSRQNYQDRKVVEIINLWHFTNKHISHLIAGLSEAELDGKTSDHNFHQICMRPLEKGTESNLAYLIEDYIYHLGHHLAQIVG